MLIGDPKIVLFVCVCEKIVTYLNLISYQIFAIILITKNYVY